MFCLRYLIGPHLSYHVECGWADQIVSGPQEGGRIIPHSAYQLIVGTAEQAPDVASDVIVVHSQEFGCPGGSLADVAVPSLRLIQSPVLLRGNPVGLLDPAGVSRPLEGLLALSMMGCTPWARMRGWSLGANPAILADLSRHPTSKSYSRDWRASDS